MTAWDLLLNDHPGIAGVLGWARELLDGGREQMPETYFRELGMSAAAASVAADPGTVAAGVFGFGAWADGDAVVPAVFVQAGLAPRAGAALGRTQARHLFPPAARRDVLRGLRAVGLSQPVPTASAAPGVCITVGSQHATAGAPVHDLETGVGGFLTAGHAAPIAGAVVRDRGGAAVGKVERTQHLRSIPGTDAVADAAFVANDRQVPPPIRYAPGRLRIKEPITLMGQRGPRQTWIRGLLPELALDPNLRAWADVGLTAEAVSRAGDSGGPVVDPAGMLVGHAVGGTPTDYSLVQDLETQLAALAVELL